ncbi:MAG: hypothetical protein C4325_09970, partial [Blastocatellia bacterium]
RRNEKRRNEEKIERIVFLRASLIRNARYDRPGVFRLPVFHCILVSTAKLKNLSKQGVKIGEFSLSRELTNR